MELPASAHELGEEDEGEQNHPAIEREIHDLAPLSLVVLANGTTGNKRDDC